MRLQGIPDRAAKPLVFSVSRPKDCYLYVVQGGHGMYVTRKFDVITSWNTSVKAFDEWIAGNDSWEQVPVPCLDPDLDVDDGL